MKRLLLLVTIASLLLLTYLGLSVMQGKQSATGIVRVYFFYNERVYPVLRQLDPGQNAALVAMQQLTAGLTKAELDRGLVSLLPSEVRVVSVQQSADILVVTFNAALLSVSGGNQLIQGLLKQIVYTATALPGVSAVAIQIEGRPGKALAIGGEGYIIDAPLTRGMLEGD